MHVHKIVRDKHTLDGYSCSPAAAVDYFIPRQSTTSQKTYCHPGMKDE